jgi:hypothetical protein
MRRSGLLFALLLLALWPSSAAAAGGGPNRAALVIRYSAEQAQTRCVSFTEPWISGLELLKRGGAVLTVNYNIGLGGAICSINNAGCAFPAQDCFCRCRGASCVYWAYFHGVGGTWQYSDVGASSYQVRDGALEGWSWGEGEYETSGALPPAITFDEICPPPATSTATPTRTPTPTPSAAPSPTATIRPASSEPAPPQVQFTASAVTVAPGTCLVLRWLAWDATTVTLDGAAALAQDQREVCPASSRRYVLTAANVAGQTTREVAVQVTAGPTPPPTPAASAIPSTPTPEARAAQAAAPHPPTLTATVTAAPTVEDAHGRPALREGLAGIEAVVLAQEAPPALPVTPPAAPLTLAGQAARPLPAATARPANGPTATPILLARGGGDNGSPPPAAPERSFQPALLPQYGAYMLTMSLLLAAGWIIARRKLSAPA